MSGLYVTDLADKTKITRVLIANRGEIAARIIRTCRALDVLSVAIYTSQDSHAEFWRDADIQHYAGDIEVDGNPYMDIDKLINIARQHSADAIHPGYGFLSENAEFAKRVVETGVLWIGPRHETIGLLGDKSACKDFLKGNAGGRVPLVPGVKAQHLETLLREIKHVGYPVLLKAAAGGGGKGMCVVNSDTELRETFETTKAEAQRLFGSDEILCEKYLPDCKHVEVQMFGDGEGGCVLFGDRDCSVQRRHQKVIEECPALVSDELKGIMAQAAKTIARITQYANAATIEFLVDVAAQKAYFLEVNTRIQVEHPVTEQVYGLDLVALQFYVAAGGKLDSLPRFDPKGHSIQLRLYAEDPYQDFMPQSGLITYFGTGSADARFENAASTGQTVSINFDPLITKIIVTGHIRQEAIATARRACVDITCLGLQTNQLFLEQCLKSSTFRDATYTTSFIGNNLQALLWRPDSHGAAAIVAVSAIVRTTKYSSRDHGRLPRTSQELITSPGGHQFLVRGVNSATARSDAYAVELQAVAELPEDVPRTALNKEGYKWIARFYETQDAPVIARVLCNILKSKVAKLKTGTLLVLAEISIQGQLYRHIATVNESSDGVQVIHFKGSGTYVRRSALVGFGSLDQRSSTLRAGVEDYKAPMPGRVIRIDTATGSQADVGQCLLVLESMKTEVRVLARTSGMVELFVKTGDVVDAGTILAVVAKLEA